MEILNLWRSLVGRWGSGVHETDEIRIDASTNTIQTIDYPHHEIHAGSHFFLEGTATLGVAGVLRVKLVTPDTAKWSHFVWDIGSSGILGTTFDEDATGGMADGKRPTIHANNRNINCWTGKHTGADDQATVLTDSTKSWAEDELIGFQVFNTTDESSGIITANTATTVTVAALAGGTGNDWDTGDTYEINKSQLVITKGVDVAASYTQRIGNTKFGSKSAGGTHARTDEVILKQNTTYLRTFTSDVASNVVNFKASWYEHSDKH